MKKKTAAKPKNKSSAIYDPSQIESKWQKRWAKAKIYRSKESKNKDGQHGKYYVLDMFPYPSGEGLHVGHPKGYIATDVVSRMNRMQGKSVLHPMGFDAFGLPAENYAIKMKKNPMDLTAKNVARFKEQLEILGLDYDWSREINTTDPKYYKWTQWIFLQLSKKGLARESYEPVNWCPKDKTVLANEDVENGRCERCGTLVEKKPMRQWVLKITDYAERLLRDLDVQVLPNGDYFGSTPEGEPYIVHMNELGAGKVRQDKPFVEREAISAFVEHWSGDKFIVLKWKKVDWRTPVTGGIENGQTAEEAARAEIEQETGFKNLELIMKAGRKMHSTFFHVPKDENRIGHFTCFHFKLKNGDKQEIDENEKSIHEIIWVERGKMRETITAQAQKVAWALVMGEKMGEEARPLLDWPESIKEAQRNWIGRSEGAEIDFRLGFTNNKTRFVLLHGFEGSAHTNFFPWLKAELEKRGHQVEAPELPNSLKPREAEQVEYVVKNCHFDENTVVIGHSLGVVVAMKALMKLNKPVSGLVVAAAAVDPKFDTNYGSRPYSKDFKWTFDFAQIKALTNGRIAVLSDTREPKRTPYLKYLADQLSARLIETTSTDEHFTADKEPAVLDSVTPSVKVFTTRPDTLFGVTYIVLAPEHPLVGELLTRVENKAEVEAYILKSKNETEIERTDATKEKTGVQLKGIKAVNPANNEEVPVWIADYVLGDYGTGAVMAVPAHDERDWEFAKKFGLPIRHVVAPERKALTTDIAFREQEPMVKRDVIRAVVKHWSEDAYLILNWNGNGWKTFISGGIEKGEDPLTAAKREIIEETGYTDLEFISEIGGPIRALFYAPHKKQNRIDVQQGLLFRLKSGAQNAVSKDEQAIHTLEWVPAAKTDKIFNATLVDQVLLARIKANDTGAFLEDGVLIRSGAFDGKKSAEIRKEITSAVGGKWVTKYKLRDWVFSRQRYWGEPIPVIHCEKHGVLPVPEKDLPVELPRVKSYEPTGTGESPLAAISRWVNVACPICKKLPPSQRGKARRETNTMPQWAGSSWYYLRYMDPKNAKKLVDGKKERYWAPVDLYVGGAEHATRHLIYARFWHKFLYDIGAVSTIEPFMKLQSVGLIMGEDGRKMSKRFGNVVNPDDIVKAFGADTLRIYELFMGPFDQQIAWSTDGMLGPRRFIERVWRLKEKVSTATTYDSSVKLIHKTIKKVSSDIQALRFNTAVSTLMIAVNELEKCTVIPRDHYEALLKLLAPFAPHAAEELWATLGNMRSIHLAAWPAYDAKLAADSEATIIVQVDGRVRGSFKAETGAEKGELEKMARDLPEAKKWLEGKTVSKIIVVPDRLVNIVLTE